MRILSWHGRPGRAHGLDARATIYGALYKTQHLKEALPGVTANEASAGVGGLTVAGIAS